MSFVYCKYISISKRKCLDMNLWVLTVTTWFGLSFLHQVLDLGSFLTKEAKTDKYSHSHTTITNVNPAKTAGFSLQSKSMNLVNIMQWVHLFCEPCNDCREFPCTIQRRDSIKNIKSFNEPLRDCSAVYRVIHIY